MTRLLLIPSAQTDWHAAGRIAGDTDLPLSESGMRQAVAQGRILALFNPTIVYSGPEESARQTASLMAHELGVRSRAEPSLKEVALGHWQGLTEQEFEERFGKVHRAWRSDPRTVAPPEGEAVTDAEERLLAGLAKIVKRRKEQTLAVVLGLLAGAIVRCHFDAAGYERFWEFVDEPPTHHELEVTPASFARPQSADVPPIPPSP